MELTTLIPIAAGLSMDAFAVSVCKGLGMKKINYWHMFIISLFFGGFQALMPLIGWLIGRRFESYIKSFDHWTAFFLLLFIGGKMILEKDNEEDYSDANAFDIKELLILAIATSIDALAVGITFAFLSVDIVGSVSVIGGTAFIFSSAGVIIGNKFGTKYKSKAEKAGGVILILIGAKILIEHLMNL